MNYFKKQLPYFVIIFFIFSAFPFASIHAASGQPGLRGRILLQVEKNGEAWYVNPSDGKRYFLGRPDDAFRVMKKFALGISNENFEKIKASVPDNLSGKIVLKVRDMGKAYYLDPRERKAYYLGRPADAYIIMGKRGIGIRNNELNKIAIGNIELLNSINDPKTANSSDLDICLLESKLHAMINAERVKRGLSAFDWDPTLAAISRYHSQDMANRGYLDATDPDGCDTACRLKQNDYYYKKIAESLSSGYAYKYKYSDGSYGGGFRTIEEIAASILGTWSNSKYIFVPEYKNQGIGIALGQTGKFYATNDLSVPIITFAEQEELKKFTLALVAGISGEPEKIAKIHDWITGNISYDAAGYLSGSISDESYAAYPTFKNRVGVCQGYAELMLLMLRYSGIESTLISGTADGYGGSNNHIWNKLAIGGEELYIDPTWNAGHIENNKFVKDSVKPYYLIPKECISVDHFDSSSLFLSVADQKKYVSSHSEIFDQKCPLLKAKILAK